MRWSKTVTMVEAHAEGEVGRIVTGGVIDVPGKTIADKLRHLNEVDDSLRRFLVFEPRAAAQMSTCLVFPPTRPDADVGFIILQGDKAHAMSGSNSICLTTVLLETGMLPMTEPETVVRIDTASGLVTARATCRDGKCERVTLTMNPSYADRLDAVVDVEGYGKVKLDIGYGGIFYALIDPAQLGLEIVPEQARKLVAAGSAIHRAVNARYRSPRDRGDARHLLHHVRRPQCRGTAQGGHHHAARPHRSLTVRHRQFGPPRGCRRPRPGKARRSFHRALDH